MCFRWRWQHRIASGVGCWCQRAPEGDGGGSTTPAVAITTTAASVTSDKTLSSRIGPLIAQYMTNTEDGQFASFLADFERALN